MHTTDHPRFAPWGADRPAADLAAWYLGQAALWIHYRQRAISLTDACALYAMAIKLLRRHCRRGDPGLRRRALAILIEMEGRAVDVLPDATDA